jgi:hypothetical protein
MSVPAARRRLPALLALLRANGVTSYDDGTVKVTLGVMRPLEMDGQSYQPPPLVPGGAPPRKRAPRDAVDLAIHGIDFDPGAEEPREADA